MANLSFNAATVDPAKEFVPVPANWYNVQIVKSDIAPTKAGTGTRLNLQQKIMDGEFAGRIIFTGLNIQNPNPVAQQIAQEQLSAICHATGAIQIQDSNELHGLPYQVKAVVTAAKDGYAARNDVTAWKAIAGASAVSAPPQVQQPAQQQTQPQQQFPPQQQQQQQAAPQQAPQQQPAAPAQQQGADPAAVQQQQPAAQTQMPAATTTPPWAQ